MEMNRTADLIEALRRKMVIAGAAGLHNSESIADLDHAFMQDESDGDEVSRMQDSNNFNVSKADSN